MTRPAAHRALARSGASAGPCEHPVAESRADRWMHEHAAAADVEVDAVVGEGRLDSALIRRMDEEGYPNEAP